MTEKIRSDELIPAGVGRIRELEVENENLKRENKALRAQRPAAKRFISTSMITAPPTSSPKRNLMVSTTHPEAHPVGHKPMIQSHNLPAPETPEQTTEKILNRVKKDREADVQRKEAKTK